MTPHSTTSAFLVTAPHIGARVLALLRLIGGRRS
ncbi:hypothetical protein SAMN05421508_101408 [Caenispirillum bisanense]|uniref:Uncharacterized protein n=1 Tax=Caenispirillum bisanense TaxID=414052 RepID=A0A286G4U9_9PROT|nr:hypothetical protein SAMN05421508_101408 [Caenispirillum bisanense]